MKTDNGMESEVESVKSELTDLPASWAWRTMDEISEVVGGATPKTGEPENYEGGTIAWLTPADLSGYTDKYIQQGARFITKKGLESCSTKLLPKGTVLFTSRAPIGYVAIASGVVCTNQGFKSYVPDTTQVTSDYLYWWLKGAKAMAEAVASGTTFLELSTVKARKLPIPLAPLPQQRRIVSAIELQLGRLDAAVARLQAAKAKLKRYKQAVLKAAVEGTLGTIPDTESEANGQEILDRLLNERREKWNGRGKYKEPAEPVLDDLPALPDGWAWATVEQLSTKVVDGVHKKPNYVDSGVPFVTVRNLTAGPGISFESLKYITEEDHSDFIKRANPEFGDVLISKDGTLGVVRYVDTHKVFSIFVSVAMIKPVDRTMGEYLSVALSSPVVQVQMVPKGSGLQHIHLEDLRADCVPIPPVSIQRWIVEEYNSYESRTQELETTLDAELMRSTHLRQAVLKRAFEGRLGVMN